MTLTLTLRETGRNDGGSRRVGLWAYGAVVVGRPATGSGVLPVLLHCYRQREGMRGR
jgi:hypothetical protein